MKQNKNKIKWGTLLVTFLLLLCMPTEFVYAAPLHGSITIELTQDLGEKSDVKFSIYKVANWDPTSEKWILITGPTSEKFEQINRESASSIWGEAAAELALEVDGIAPQQRGTDAEGKAVFGSLDLGMYLVLQEDANKYGTVSPFLISLPQKEEGVYNYDPVAKPKATALPEESGGNATVPGNNVPGNSSNESSSEESNGDTGAPMMSTNSETPMIASLLSTDNELPKKNNIKAQKKQDQESQDWEMEESVSQTGEDSVAVTNSTELDSESLDNSESDMGENDDEITAAGNGINPIAAVAAGVVVIIASASGVFIFLKKKGS